MASMYIPPYTISFTNEPLIDTMELQQELGISYDTLHSRIRFNNFPRPVQLGRNGKTAKYSRSELIAWLKSHGFNVAE